MGNIICSCNKDSGSVVANKYECKVDIFDNSPLLNNNNNSINKQLKTIDNNNNNNEFLYKIFSCKIIT